MSDDDAEEIDHAEATEDDARAAADPDATEDDAEADDAGATEDDQRARGRDADEETVKDVDHEHPTTGETFDRTGVHGRGKAHPDETAIEDSEGDSTDDGADNESA